MNNTKTNININNINNNITIYLKDKIDTTNAAIIENEINNVAANIHQDDKLILDFNDVTYISSTGLRIILNTKKKHNNMLIINVSLEVYDIFEVTGFTKLINIKKRYRNINIDNCEIIGEGACGIVYKYSDDQIVKVFKYDITIEEVEKEIELSRQAFILGIPTAIPFDIVKVNNKYGLIFELLPRHSVCKQLINKTLDVDKFIPIYASLFKELQKIKIEEGSFLNITDEYINKLDKYVKKYLTIDEYNRIKYLLLNTNDNSYIIHGDCHIKNIMLSDDDKPIIIDLETLSRGSKIYEFAGIYCSYISFSEADEQNTLKFFNMSQDIINNIFFGMMDILYPKNLYNQKEIYDKICIVSSILLISYVYMYEDGNNELRINQAIKHIKELIYQYDNLDI